MEEHTVRHQHSYSDPRPELRIKVEKGQRNTYGWEISAPAPGHDAVPARHINRATRLPGDPFQSR